MYAQGVNDLSQHALAITYNSPLPPKKKTGQADAAKGRYSGHKRKRVERWTGRKAMKLERSRAQESGEQPWKTRRQTAHLF